jgi:hypothetical protein
LLAGSEVKAAYERVHAVWLAKAEKQQRQQQAEVKVLREQMRNVRLANGVYRAKLVTAEDLLRLSTRRRSRKRKPERSEFCSAKPKKRQQPGKQQIRCLSSQQQQLSLIRRNKLQCRRD